jgi:hypothetical protein
MDLQKCHPYSQEFYRLTETNLENFVGEAAKTRTSLYRGTGEENNVSSEEE